jgi:hypothetical protein
MPTAAPEKKVEVSKKQGLRDPDTQQKLLNYVHFAVDMYKAVMTSLLTLFIPQKCDAVPRCPTPLTAYGYWEPFTNTLNGCLKLCAFTANDSSSGIFGYYNERVDHVHPVHIPTGCDFSAGTLQLSQVHTCGMTENIKQVATGFGIFVLIWNFITLGVIVAHYVVMLRRENWLVEYLDEDDNLPDDYLKNIIDKYPTIKAGLAEQNKFVFTSAFSSLTVLLVNAVVSGILVFRSTHNDGFRTATTYITNLLLMLMVLKTCAVNAWVGIQNTLALSCVNVEPLAFNKIDTDHLNDNKLAPASPHVGVAVPIAVPATRV